MAPLEIGGERAQCVVNGEASSGGIWQTASHANTNIVMFYMMMEKYTLRGEARVLSRRVPVRYAVRMGENV